MLCRFDSGQSHQFLSKLKMRKTLYSFPKYNNQDLGFNTVSKGINLQQVKPSSSFIDFNDNFKIGNIQLLIDQGFSRVANVYLPYPKSNLWNYKAMDPNLMFSKKEGWVYAITLEGDIYKIGMTGTVLGRRAKRADVQPVGQTDNRLGRYRQDFTNYNTDVVDTDERIRRELYQHLLHGAEVSFYVKSYTEHSIGQIEQVEKTYLTEYMNQFGKLPLGNLELG